MSLDTLPTEVFISSIQPYLSSIDLRNLRTAYPQMASKIDWRADEVKNETWILQLIRMVVESKYNRGMSTEYALNFQRFTGIPVMWYEDEGRQIPYIGQKKLLTYLRGFQTHYLKLVIRLPATVALVDFFNWSSNTPKPDADLTMELPFDPPGAMMYDIVCKVEEVNLFTSQKRTLPIGLRVTRVQVEDTTVTVFAKKR